MLDAIAFGFALAIGALLVYCFWLILTTGAFWVVRMEHVLELFEGIYQTGRWPVGVYPGWLRYSATFLVPVGFAVTVPAQAVTSRHGSSGRRSCSRSDSPACCSRSHAGSGASVSATIPALPRNA